ncbi:MAG: cytochrome P450 [Natronosporangium sp.]
MTTPAIRYPFLEQPEEVLPELRPQGPLVKVTLWNGKWAWLVIRHADALRALTDPRLSADMTDINFPSLNPSQPVPNDRPVLSRIDNDRHREIRSLVANRFTARAVRKWRSLVEQIVAEQLTSLLRDGPPADLVTTFALPVTLRLICRVVGVPEQDSGFVTHHAHGIMMRAYESSRASNDELYDYLDRLVRDNEANPGEGLIGELVEHRRAGAITRKELVLLAQFLLVAGHTSATATIGLSVLSLLEQPEHYRALRDNPALAASMVEEFLRFQTITRDGATRVAKRDLVLGGVTIRAGEAVVVSLALANRDETVFTDPDSFRPHRANLKQHIALGWGAHRCLGQHLARMELRVALTALARTIPTLRLAVPIELLRFGHLERHVSNVRELPVSW